MYVEGPYLRTLSPDYPEPLIIPSVRNVYFDLTIEFNRERTIALLTSGQAVVYYRTAIMSKDGDWVVEETTEACGAILSVLASRGARYRPGAPIDVRWLAGGWSSHFEFRDEKGRRIRCDFLSRPPRVAIDSIRRLLRTPPEPGKPSVIDVESLIRMKRTQRAKDYPVIGELARLLPPEREVLYTTDPDRILELAGCPGEAVDRLPVREARRGGTREDVVIALARDTNALQEADRVRLEAYARASGEYLTELVRSGLLDRPLGEAHAALVEMAGRRLPPVPPGLPAEGGSP